MKERSTEGNPSWHVGTFCKDCSPQSIVKKCVSDFKLARKVTDTFAHPQNIGQITMNRSNADTHYVCYVLDYKMSIIYYQAFRGGSRIPC